MTAQQQENMYSINRRASEKTRIRRGVLSALCCITSDLPFSGICLAPGKFFVEVMRKRIYAISLYRRDLCIYGGSRGQEETLVRGNWFPRDLWHFYF